VLIGAEQAIPPGKNIAEVRSLIAYFLRMVDAMHATGLNVEALNAANLADAFNKIASEIVRLAK